MKRVIVIATFSLAAAAAGAAPPLSCREDPDTKATVCYERKTVRSNGELRSFTMATGGPKSVDKAPYLGVVNCRVKYLELRDRKGVVVSRDVPKKAHLRYLVSDVCEEPRPKPDKSLD